MMYPTYWLKTIGIITGIFVLISAVMFMFKSIDSNTVHIESSGSEMVVSEYSSSSKPVLASANKSESVSTSKDKESNSINTADTDSWSIGSAFKESTEDEVISLMEDNKVLGIAKDKQYIYVETTDGEHLKIGLNNSILDYAAIRGLDIHPITATNTTTTNSAQEQLQVSTVITYATVLIFFVMLAIILQRAYKASSGNSLCAGEELRRSSLNSSSSSESTTTATKKKSQSSDIPTIRFSDVQGVEELKKDIFRIVDFLRNSEKYKEMGARTPKGIILYGPPGTGKTLLAKAIAGEAGVPFFHANGSDFVEMYVGVGAKRVRELYQKARKAAPSIVFIDEVDAIAHKRGQANNSEDDKTINALLNELDGFKGDTNVVTICATNRLDLLDSAFQRAGRFDLKLAVNLPDKKARYEILKIHSRNKHFQNPKAIKELAKKTPGFSGAELEGILNEAAILAASNNQDYITDSNIEEAFYKILLKGNKKKSDFSRETMEKIAWHESGHVLVTKLLTNDKVPSVTIIGSTSGAGGVTFRIPDESNLRTRRDLRNEIAIKFGGRAAEELLVNDKDLVTTGASQDITEATSIIKAYICEYGMGNSGLIDHTQFTEKQSETIESEAIELSNSVYSDTLKLLNDNYSTLQNLAMALLDNETLSEEEIDSIIDTGKLPADSKDKHSISSDELDETDKLSSTEEAVLSLIDTQKHVQTAYDLAVPIWKAAGCKEYDEQQIDDLYYRLKLREARKGARNKS